VWEPGPSPGFSSRGGQKPEGGAKTQKGATFLKYCIGCMQQPGIKREMGATDFKWGAWHHWPPPLATALVGMHPKNSHFETASNSF